MTCVSSSAAWSWIVSRTKKNRQKSRVKRDNRSEAEIVGLTKIKNASKQPKAARREAERINGDKRMGFLIRGMGLPDAEGIQAISLWLSEETPPVKR